jgi:redox-sensitive bicupin YhaK (pirin superfamily)
MPELVIDQRRRDLGGLEVGRVLPYAQHRMVGPFIFFDHLGPIDFAPGIPRSVDVRPHPHIGLATVTYLFAGEVMHRDSVASEQAIRPGEVNWMVAGRGVTHSERFEYARAHGGPLHGIQSWVALPREAEETEPSFAHFDRRALPLLEDNGATGTLLAGEISGVAAPVATYSPLFYLHWTLPAGTSIQLPGSASERAAYVVSGQLETAGRALMSGQMLVYSRSENAVLRATTAATVMVLGGEPVGERFIEWNFVSSSKERIVRAKADWRAGRFKLPDFDNHELIPLPPEPPPPPAGSPL